LTSDLNSASYTPTNTAARSCPTVSAGYWQATNSPLPPSPNVDLCSCMLSSLSCRAASSVAPSDYAQLFYQVCGYNNGAPCKGIIANATTGTYGAYSMCPPVAQLSWAFNAYYMQQNKAADACKFGGSGTVVSPSPASSCSALLNQAGASGTGVVTNSPTATGNVAEVTSNGQTGSNGAASTSKAAASGLVVGASFGRDGWYLGAYIVGAILTGAGMLIL
jgi:hypothetical protein